MSEPSPTRANRVTMTKSQRQQQAGAELLLLLDEITSDGQVTALELRQLDRWLAAHKDDDLPAIDFLDRTIERIMADGTVTAKECEELYKAIERVLPADLRNDAKSRRQQRDLELVRAQEEREAAAQQRQVNVAARERQMAEAGEIAAVDLHFHVAGVTHENRHQLVAAHARPGQNVYLVRDPNNQYSRNAIAIYLENGMHIGFVPERLAVQLAPHLDAGYKQLAYIQRLFEIGNTEMMCPMIEGGLYVRHSTFPGALSQMEVPFIRRTQVEVAQPVVAPAEQLAAAAHSERMVQMLMVATLIIIVGAIIALLVM